MFEDFLSSQVIPVIATFGLLYMGGKALFLHDLRGLRGKDARPLKDEENYCKWAGILLLFLAVVSAAMALLSYFAGPIPGMVVLAAGLIVFMALWVRMNDRYGE